MDTQVRKVLTPGCCSTGPSGPSTSSPWPAERNRLDDDPKVVVVEVVPPTRRRRRASPLPTRTSSRAPSWGSVMWSTGPP